MKAMKSIDQLCLAVACPTCFSRRKQRCTQANNRSRHPVAWTHLSRQHLWEAEQSGVQK